MSEHTIVGRRIAAIVPVPKGVQKELYMDVGRYEQPMQIVLDDGSIIIPLRDPEGNGFGDFNVRKPGPKADYYGYYASQ